MNTDYVELEKEVKDLLNLILIKLEGVKSDNSDSRANLLYGGSHNVETCSDKLAQVYLGCVKEMCKKLCKDTPAELDSFLDASSYYDSY